jgi:hypothetical protein
MTKVKCDTYKEAIAADPSGSFDGGVEHVASCDACRRYRDEMRRFDDKIAAALAIPVPKLEIPELPPLSGNDNVVSLPFRRRLSTPSWLGIAASFAIAAVLIVRSLAPGPAYASLADEVLAHLDHEPYALEVTDQAVSERRLNRVVRAEVASLEPGIGLITYAKSCVINGKTIPHLVIQGERGPVTLLLLADEEVSSPVPLVGVGVNGVILPVGKGSIAIIGDRGEDIGAIEKRVVDSVEWSI